jgi:DtxR family Mn-dependent transcriptional regulator
MTKSLPADLSRSVEDYLKVIYQLSERGDPVTTTALADALRLAPPSISGMVKRLAESNLVEHEPYRGVTLTRTGRRAALRMLRRHRIIETYLVSHLGYSWDNVHDEAEQLEHAVSDDLVDRMSRALGDPVVDPHGDPIPAADGRIAGTVTTPLPDVAIGATVVISRVNTGVGEQLRWFAAAGLIPGAQLTMIDQQPFNGPVTVTLGADRRVIGRDLARQLLCSQVAS